jgi:uncharacterized circularly permuted ATP-grasp superfamily protein
MTIQAMLTDYLRSGAWDEMLGDNSVREPYSKLMMSLSHLKSDELKQKHMHAGELFMNQGITFTVYSDDAGIERIFPFDVIPRIITSSEWDHIERGIKQRLKALNMFLHDIYHEQQYEYHERVLQDLFGF